MPTATSLGNDREATGTAGRDIGLIGAPTDVGAGRPGASRGPQALRSAGLAEALGRIGHAVHDHGDVAGPANPLAAPVDGYRHFAETLEWCRATRDAVAASLGGGEIPILLGGDHALSIGSVAAVARHCSDRGEPLCVLWLDAHADCNTGETTPSGNIHGMAVAMLCGDGPPDFLRLGHTTPIVDPARLFQVGVRSVDAVEQRKVVERGLAVQDMQRVEERGMRAVMDEVLGATARLGGHLHVSFDVDFLDPAIAPGVATREPGGASRRDARLCMQMIHDSGLPGSLDVVEVNPAFDEHDRTAGLAVELIGCLFGERSLARVEQP